MPLVYAADLIRHAIAHRHALVELRPHSLGEAFHLREAAEACDAPLVIGIAGAALDGVALEDAMPALEAGLAQAKVPVALHYHSVPDRPGLAAAIRLGCNSVTLGTPLAPGCDATSLIALGRSCGIATELAGDDLGPAAEPDLVAYDGAEISAAAISNRRGRLGKPVALRAAAVPANLPELVSAGVAKVTLAGASGSHGGAAAASSFRALAEASGAAGQGRAAIAECRVFEPVEHVVAFNAPSLSPSEIDRLFAIGREALGAVPGVRQVRIGRALAANARYRLCWFIRFANAAVADAYRTDPAHLAFADQHFRPVAADRMTIDFGLS